MAGSSGIDAMIDGGAIARAGALLVEAEAPVRVLRHLAWPATVRERFFAAGARELPRVGYPAFDAQPVLERVRRARAELAAHDGVVAHWLGRQADAIEAGARLLADAGTPAFTRHSRALFGAPDEIQPDEEATPLAFARQLETLTGDLDEGRLGPRPPASRDADDLAGALRDAVGSMFGAEGPDVIVVDELSANALAGPENIRVRRGARFTERDIGQLVEHEAGVHVLTSLNGRAQDRIPLLACSHPGTTRTQEGLAVLAELVTGHMELERMRRLADRVLAIDMALDGADFLEVYRFFLERTGDAEQSFENARRVFRGAPVTGGAAFTKDVVYLDGLLRVHGFMRSAVLLGRTDLLPLLFAGKLDVEDVPALAELSARGLCRPPRFLPHWIADLRGLLGHLVFTAFLDSIDLGRLRAHYAEMAAAASPADRPDE